MKITSKKPPRQNDPEYTYYAKDATAEDIYAFDTAENWAKCMNQLQYKLIELGENKRKAEKRKKTLAGIKK